MSQSKKKYMDLCQLANKYKQAVLETLSWTSNNSIQRVTYVTLAVKMRKNEKHQIIWIAAL